jgi:hypothetical protein
MTIGVIICLVITVGVCVGLAWAMFAVGGSADREIDRFLRRYEDE